MGVELHKVPLHKEQEVASQDELVEGLLTMLLSIMDNIHDKAPVRKAEERQERGDKAGSYTILKLPTKEIR